MNAATLPSMWRQELIHPLLVHLSIGLIPVTTFFLLAYLVLNKEKYDDKFLFLRPAFTWLLAISALGVIAAIKSGDLAENVVNKVICDPTVTNQHEDLAETVLILVLVTFALEMARCYFRKKKPVFVRLREKKLDYFLCFLMIIATGFLFQVGHLGASLTYQQGAGVYHPDAECRGFSE